MGMFSKSPAEKKLEHLTGGFILSDEYKAILRANNIEYSVGEHIKNQLKEEIKLNIVSEEGLETRLRYLIKQNSKKDSTKKEISEFETQKEPEVIIAQSPLKRYEDEIKTLKIEYDAKEKVVTNLIEKSFAPPQITYDKFMDHVKNANKVFNSEAVNSNKESNADVENLLADMKDLIDSVKKYE